MQKRTLLNTYIPFKPKESHSIIKTYQIKKLPQGMETASST